MVVSNILFLREECARLSSLQFFLADILASQLLQIFMQKVFTGSEDRRGQWKIYLKKRRKASALFFSFLTFLFFYQNINAVTKVLKRTVTEEVDQASVQLIGKTIVDKYIAISDVFLSSGCTDLFCSSVLMKCTTDGIFLLKKKWSRTLLY